MAGARWPGLSFHAVPTYPVQRHRYLLAYRQPAASPPLARCTVGEAHLVYVTPPWVTPGAWYHCSKHQTLMTLSCGPGLGWTSTCVWSDNQWFRGLLGTKRVSACGETAADLSRPYAQVWANGRAWRIHLEHGADGFLSACCASQCSLGVCLRRHLLAQLRRNDDRRSALLGQLYTGFFRRYKQPQYSPSEYHLPHGGSKYSNSSSPKVRD